MIGTEGGGLRTRTATLAGCARAGSTCSRRPWKMAPSSAAAAAAAPAGSANCTSAMPRDFRVALPRRAQQTGPQQSGRVELSLCHSTRAWMHFWRPSTANADVLQHAHFKHISLLRSSVLGHITNTGCRYVWRLRHTLAGPRPSGGRTCPALACTYSGTPRSPKAPARSTLVAV